MHNKTTISAKKTNKGNARDNTALKIIVLQLPVFI